MLRLLDCRSELTHPYALVSFVKVLGNMKYQNDHFWETATELVLHNFKRIQSEHVKLEILRGYAAAKRGSDEFWRYTVKHLMEEVDNKNTLFHEPLLRDVTLAAIGLKLSLPANIMDYQGFTPSSLGARMEHLQGPLPSSTSEDLAYILLNHTQCSKKHADLFEENIGHNWRVVHAHSRQRILQMYELKGRPQYFEEGEKVSDGGLALAERIAQDKKAYEQSLGDKVYLPFEQPEPGSRDFKLYEDDMISEEGLRIKAQSEATKYLNDISKERRSKTASMKKQIILGEDYDLDPSDQEIVNEMPELKKLSKPELLERLAVVKEQQRREALDAPIEEFIGDSDQESEEEEPDEPKQASVANTYNNKKQQIFKKENRGPRLQDRQQAKPSADATARPSN